MLDTCCVTGHVDKVLITTCLGSRGLEKKIVVYISPENMGDFLAIVKEKNFIEVVSRSINQVTTGTLALAHSLSHYISPARLSLSLLMIQRRAASTRRV